jgi:E3 ubiquitin-protein ligase HUWE1
VENSPPQRTPLVLSASSDEETGFKSLISLMGSRLYQSSANHLIPLLTVLQEVIEREAEHPPVLDEMALSQVCSMLSFDSLGDNGVTIVVDIIHKLSQNPINRLLVEPAVTNDLMALKSELITMLSTINFASADVQKQVQLLRLCKVLKNVNPEAQLNELEELWTHLSSAFKAVAESEGEGTGLSAVLTRLLPLVETYFVTHSDCPLEEITNFFSDRNRKILNLLVKQNPALLESTLVLLTQRFYSLLDFENKREYFKSQTKNLHANHAGDTIRLKVHRNNIFIDSFHKLKSRAPQEMYGRLQVDFIGEEGLDLGGPTREWYSALSREMFNPDYALFVLAANGVSFQPNPRSYVNSDHLDFFRFVGKIIGKALVDGINLELHFTRSFYKHILGQPVTVQDMEDLDPEIYKSLQQLLSLDVDSTDLFEDYFTYEEEHFGNVVTKELVPNGKNLRVTEANKADYVQRLCNMKMTDGIRAQIEAFLEGLYSLVKKELLAIFDAKELELLVAGLHEISVDDLRDNTEYQGFSPDSPLITWFWDILEAFSNEQRAQVLQFVTGSSKVPLEGFKALRGSSGVQLFQIHKSFASPERLPTAHTW